MTKASCTNDCVGKWSSHAMEAFTKTNTHALTQWCKCSILDIFQIYFHQKPAIANLEVCKISFEN